MKIKINKPDAMVAADCLDSAAAMYRAAAQLRHSTDAERHVNTIRAAICEELAATLRARLGDSTVYPQVAPELHTGANSAPTSVLTDTGSATAASPFEVVGVISYDPETDTLE